MIVLRSCATFLFLLLLIGCGRLEPATPTATSTGSVPAVSQITPTILPTNTAVVSLAERETPTATVSLTDTLTPRPTPTPANPNLLATAAYIVVDAWSVDGQWLAYWLSSTADVENTQPYTSPGGQLYVANLLNGEICPLPHFQAEVAGQFSLEWQPDNNLIVQNRETYQRRRVEPCRPGTFPLPTQPPAGRLLDEGLSPNGRYRITTELQDEADNILTFTTVLSHRDTAEIMAVTWQISDYLHDEPVGIWVSSTQFLIWHSLDGPLLLDATRPGKVTNVLLDLFDRETTELYIEISAASGVEPDTFYLLLLFWSGQESVQLFHAHSGLIETLPYTRHWWPPFTPDGEWLLLAEYDHTGTILTRRVSDINGEWQKLFELLDPHTGATTLWNDSITEVAFGEDNRITWLTFPAGENVEQWLFAEPILLRPNSWSPDGRFLTAIGVGRGSLDQALLIFDRHGEMGDDRRSGRLP